GLKTRVSIYCLGPPRGSHYPAHLTSKRLQLLRVCECSDVRFDPKRTLPTHRRSPNTRRRTTGCFYPCFAMRLGGVSDGKDTQGCRDSSHTPIAGAGKFGSAKLPMATATYPGKPSPSQ